MDPVNMAGFVAAGMLRGDHPQIDDEAYKERNRVERLVNKMKHFRRIATRYDKLQSSFLSLIQLTLSFIKVRAIVNRT